MPPVSEKLARALYDVLGMQFIASTRATVDPASVAAEGVGFTDVTVTGAALGDLVLFGVGTADLLNVNAGIQVYVADANTVTIVLANNTVAAGAAIDLASAVWTIVVLRRAR